MASLFVSWRDRSRCCSRHPLLAGTALLVAPLAVTGMTLGYVPLDPASCTQSRPQPGIRADRRVRRVVAGASSSAVLGRASCVPRVRRQHPSLARSSRCCGGSSHPRSSEAAGGFIHCLSRRAGILLGTAAFARLLGGDVRKVPVDTARCSPARSPAKTCCARRAAPTSRGCGLCPPPSPACSPHAHFDAVAGVRRVNRTVDRSVPLVIGFAVIRAGAAHLRHAVDALGADEIHIDRWFLVGSPMVVSLSCSSSDRAARQLPVRHHRARRHATGVLFITDHDDMPWGSSSTGSTAGRR